MHRTDPLPPATSAPAIGVLIPTFNRWPLLLQCLRHLEAQTCKSFEVIVVDDGSTDSTPQELAAYQTTAPFPLRILSQQNSGQARARNQAIAHLAAPLCILIGDDIFPTPDFVRLHLDFHRAHPQPEAIAIGLTRWSEHGQTVTPFMRWLDTGTQFAFPNLFAGVAPDWRHFWTSNLSAKTAYLRQNPFHEGFRKYGMEDIELGFRLATHHALAMFFLPQALAEHLHPTTFLQSCDRAVHAGAATFLFAQLWPQHRFLPPRSRLKRALLPLLTEPRIVLPALRFLTDRLTRLWCPNPLLRPVLLFHERFGYRRAAADAHAPRPQPTAQTSNPNRLI